MRFLQLLLGSHNRLRPRLIAWLLAASLSTMAAITLISEMVGQGAEQPVRLQQLGLFLFVAALIVFSQYMALKLTTEVVDHTLERLQRELAALFRRADLKAVETIGTARIYGIMSRTTTVLSEAGPPVINGLITTGILFCLGAYVFYLSPTAFVVMVLLAGGTVYLFRYHMEPAEIEQQHARDAEKRHFDLFVQLLDGFKEIKLNWKRGDDLQHGFMEAAGAESRLRKRTAATRETRAYSVGYAGFYLLLATVVFGLPQYFSSQESATKITYVTIFLLVTVNALMRALPMLNRANAALAELDALEDQLAAFGSDEKLRNQHWPHSFSGIRLHGVTHGDHYGVSGPFDLDLQPGQLTLITGPNCSGKTTLLRLLTGLYAPEGGTIEWDGKTVAQDALPGYRGLFAAVFDDCHLFDRIYGLGTAATEQLPALLQRLGLSEQQAARPLSELAFSSTAMRRRVALALALLDERPILVLDDILSGQDHDFRLHFTDVLVPELKAGGVCVVVTAPDAGTLGKAADHVIRLDRSPAEQ